MPKRVDLNQREIVAALRAIGASVIDTHELGHGAPDIIAGWHGRSFPMEIKNGRGKLTKDELAWKVAWRGDYYIVHNATEAIEVLFGIYQNGEDE